MNIKEAEKLTGVSSRNIRFYEQKGLLKPARNKENDYREYSDEDIRTLMLIRVLRMVDMPLEQIREVMEGKASLRIAASRQAEHLKRQIRKMEIAAGFCEELAGTDEPDVQALLTRMDEPENREMLSHKWPADYKETLQTAAAALACGLLPVVLGYLLAWPMIIALPIHESAVLILSLVLPAIWVCLGFRFHGKGKWWLNFVAAHVFPALICVPMHWQLQLPHEERIWWLNEIGLTMQTALTYFAQSQYLSILWLLLGCFCLGGFISWLVPIFRFGWKHTYGSEKTGSRLTAFWGKLFRVIPVKLVLLFVILLVPFVIVIGNIIFGPLPVCATTDHLQIRLTGTECMWVETAYTSFEVAGSEEFCECFDLEKWERVYFGSESTEILLEVHMSSDRSEPYAIEFYDGGTVRVYEAWMTLKEGYYRVPEGTAEAVLLYAQAFANAELRN